MGALLRTDDRQIYLQLRSERRKQAIEDFAESAIFVLMICGLAFCGGIVGLGIALAVSQ